MNLDRMDSDELGVMARQLREVMDHPGWGRVRRALAEEQHSYVEKMLRTSQGQTVDHYALNQADSAGYARGLRKADTLLMELADKAEKVLARRQIDAEQAQPE